MTTANPKISIIIPMYNVEKYLKQSLDSAINQTLKDIEIIIIDDCSTDNSLALAQDYAKNDKRIVVLSQEFNQGQGIARNKALDIASGEYIMFLDPDDWFEIDACEKAYNQISTNNNEIVFFNLYSWKERNGKLGKRKPADTRLKPFEQIKTNPHINLCELKTNFIHSSWVWAQIYSRKFLNDNNVRFSNDRFAEDVPFFIKACVYSQDVSILDEPLYNYRKKIGTAVINYFEYSESILSAKEKARKIILESGKMEQFWQHYIVYEIGSDALHFKNFAKGNKKIRKDLFKNIKNKFLDIQANTSKEILKKSSAYWDFKLILECNSYEEYKIKRFFKKIFKN
ncbi:MAG: glycosyltransferase family 2 protein [Candidatus Gastranaerophilales bacterium]|nr:glycosyltransferase family 2 protein [Candidatus Gastranaerophilales bacterium]